MKTVGKKTPWYKQSVSLEQISQRAPYVVVFLLVDTAYFLFRALSPYHLGDHNGPFNWFNVKGGAVAIALWVVLPILIRWKSRRSKQSKP